MGPISRLENRRLRWTLRPILAANRIAEHRSLENPEEVAVVLKSGGSAIEIWKGSRLNCQNTSTFNYNIFMPTLIRFHKTGGPEILQYDILPARPLQPGEIRLKVEAIGLNRAEVMFRSGQCGRGRGCGLIGGRGSGRGTDDPRGKWVWAGSA